MTIEHRSAILLTVTDLAVVSAPKPTLSIEDDVVWAFQLRLVRMSVERGNRTGIKVDPFDPPPS